MTENVSKAAIKKIGELYVAPWRLDTHTARGSETDFDTVQLYGIALHADGQLALLSFSSQV